MVLLRAPVAVTVTRYATGDTTAGLQVKLFSPAKITQGSI